MASDLIRMFHQSTKRVEDFSQLPDEPLVSVCILTYNHESFISDAIESVLMQKVDFGYEVVITDDNSTDSTSNIVQDFQRRYPYTIRLCLTDRNLYCENGHLPAAGMFKSARGKYIAFCEGDDYWTDPFKLQKQVDKLEGSPSVVVSCHGAMVVDPEGNVVKKRKLPSERRKDYTPEYLRKGAWLLSLSMCFRNVIDHYPEEFFQVVNADTFLVSLLGQHGSSSFDHSIKPAAYRIHSSSTWSSLDSLSKMRARFNTYLHLNKYYLRTDYNESTDYHFVTAFRLGMKLCNYYLNQSNVEVASDYFAKLQELCIKNHRSGILQQMMRGAISTFAA